MTSDQLEQQVYAILDTYPEFNPEEPEIVITSGFTEDKNKLSWVHVDIMFRDKEVNKP